MAAKRTKKPAPSKASVFIELSILLVKVRRKINAMIRSAFQIISKAFLYFWFIAFNIFPSVGLI